MKKIDNASMVLDSLKSITEKYITYHFSNYLFDEGFLNFDWAVNIDPDAIPENKLPAAKIAMDKLQEVLDNYWMHYARYYLFYLYQCLDDNSKENSAIINYVCKQSKQDIVNSVTCLCATGKIYQTQYIQPEEVSIFTGSVNKILVEHYADLDLIAIQKLDKKLFFEFIQKMTLI